jgi:hypothetical protein
MTLSNNNVAINFIIPEFETTIRLTTDITTEVEYRETPSTAFICNVNIKRDLLQDTFLFSTNDLSNWNTSTNLESTMFYVNYSLTSAASTSQTSWWSQYSATSSMFNIAEGSISNGTKFISTYTSKTSVNLIEIFGAWYMFRILNGIRDAQVLINNALDIKNNITNQFNNNVFCTYIDSVLWKYNGWVPASSTTTYLDINNITSTDPRYSFVTTGTYGTNLPYDNKRFPMGITGAPNPAFYGIPFITSNTDEEQTLPQRLFEQMSYNDFQRINSLSSGRHITPADVYNASTNPTSRIPPEILGQNINTPFTNIYKFPFIVGDTFCFRLSILLKNNNTRNIFNNNGNNGSSITVGNITADIDTLNTSFNNANTNITADDGTKYLSFLVRMNLIE